MQDRICTCNHACQTVAVFFSKGTVALCVTIGQRTWARAKPCVGARGLTGCHGALSCEPAEVR